MHLQNNWKWLSNKCFDVNVQDNTVQNSQLESKSPIKMNDEHTGTYKKEGKRGRGVNLENDSYQGLDGSKWGITASVEFSFRNENVSDLDTEVT